MNAIQPIGTPQAAPLAAPGGVSATAGGPSFKDALLSSLREVNAMQQSADQAVEKLATGGDVSPAEVLTAVQKADIAFRMMMQIRNKIAQAYDEIKNVRV